MVKYTEKVLREVVRNSTSMRGVLSMLGLKNTGGNRAYIKNRLNLFNIGIHHFLGQGHGKGGRRLTLDEFVNKVLNNHGGGWHSHQIKLKLYEFNLKEKHCENCGQCDVWLDKPLSLHLDHLDGDHTNYKLENLRILCPNCHSQIKTYAGRSNKRV